MNHDVGTSMDDLQKLQDLFKEYTAKLREICEAKLQSDFRRFQLIMWGGAMGMFSVAFVMIVAFKSLSSDVSMSLVMALAITAILAIMFVTLGGLAMRQRMRFTFDADQVATSLRKLIKLASQYSEHAQKRIAEKFEFDLRLAEAEAALRMYYKVFSKPTPIHEDDPNHI